MTLELVAAALVGVALIVLVLTPLAGAGPAAAAAPELDDFVEPDEDESDKARAVAALREIEFDRETGKLSDEDYAELKSKYTRLALDAMRAEDAAAARPDVEAMVAARVQQLRAGTAPACATCGPRPEPDALFCSDCGRALGGGYCAQCGARTRPDGSFCEQCGSRVAA